MGNRFAIAMVLAGLVLLGADFDGSDLLYPES